MGRDGGEGVVESWQCSLPREPELTGNDGESHPLYRTLHCSPACRRDTQRRAAGPSPSTAMHLSMQFLLSLSYALERSRNTRHPGSCAYCKKSTSSQVGKHIVPLSSGPGGRHSGYY